MDSGVSVAMTTLNGDRFLQEQLESIVAQSPRPLEIVIGDDGSNDGTLAVIESVRTRSAIPLRIIGGTHVGLRANVERVLRECRGAVIALADQDDVWLPDRIRAIEESFGDPAVGLWFSDAELIDERGRLMDRRLWASVGLGGDAVAALTAGRGLRRLLQGMTVTGATMAFRATLLPLVLPLPIELDGPDHLFLHDGWIAVLASLPGAIVAEPHCFTHYRQHAMQVTAMQVARNPIGEETPRRPASRHDLDQELARVRLVLDRVRKRDMLDACRPDDARTLVELEQLLSVRAASPGVGRIPALVRELFAGRYHTYARGWRTAAADLLYTRP